MGGYYSLELPPQTELIRILQDKARFLNFPLQTKVMQFLIEAFPSSPKMMIRALEALVLRLHLNAQKETVSPASITIPMVKHYLADLMAEEREECVNASEDHGTGWQTTMAFRKRIFWAHRKTGIAPSLVRWRCIYAVPD